MKNFISIMLVFTMLFAISTASFAAEAAKENEKKVYSFEISEYDVYVSIKNANLSDLEKSGMKMQTVNEIRSNTIEKKLLEMATIPDNELALKGYDIDQIKIIKNYSGEPIETNQSLKSVFATITCDFFTLSTSNAAMQVKLTWEWSQVPFFSGDIIKDMIAVRWKGTNPAGQPINLALDSSNSRCVLRYYSTINEKYYFAETQKLSTEDPYSYAYSTVVQNNPSVPGVILYPKQGSLYLRVFKIGSDYINEAAFVFAYGHPTLTLSTSIWLPNGFSIGFTGATQVLFNKALRVKSTGLVTEY